MSDERPDALSERLRAGDPYDGAPMPASAQARIRTHFRETRAPRSWTTLAPAVAATVLAVALVGLWTLRPAPLDGVAGPRPGSQARPLPPFPDVPSPRRHAAPPAPARPATSDTSLVSDTPLQPQPQTDLGVVAVRRDIRFTAPRGTQIIWTLDPDYQSIPITGRPVERRNQGDAQ